MSPPFSARCRDVSANRGAIDAVIAAVRHDFGQRHCDGFPDPGLAPAAEPAIDRIPTPILGLDISPGRSDPATILRLDR